MEFYRIAYDFLTLSGINLSLDYFRERLESHPQYPSLISLTDILDEFTVENYALSISKEKEWRRLDFPFLAHIISGNGLVDFEIITEIPNESEFLNKWTGIVLLLGNQKTIKHKEHNDKYKEEKLEKSITLSITLVLLCVLVVNQLLNFETVVFIHFMLSLIGFGLSYLIISNSLGLKSNIGDLFCKIEEVGCNKVLNSRLGKFGGNTGLGDIVAVFFASIIIYLSFTNDLVAAESLLLLLVVLTPALVFTPISIIYQWQLKSWCRLCLAVVLLIWIQYASLLWYFFVSGTYSLNISRISPETYVLFGVSLSLAAIWLIIKPLIIQNKEVLSQRIRIRKWRQNPDWFNALLPLHKQIDDSYWEKEIKYGNPNGVLQIIVVSNPYCEFCSIAHSELNTILEKHPNDIGVRIRFAIKSFDIEDENYKAVFQILRCYENFVWKNKSDMHNLDIKNIIDHWYQYKNLSKWKFDLHDRTNYEDIDKLVKKSINWSNNMGITQTPAFFINGYEMPNPHTFKDLFLFVSDYIDILKTKEKSAL